MEPVLWALFGGTLTFGATSLGSASVFFLRKPPRPVTQTILLGLAAGIMIAAAVWSLLMPAMALAEEQGIPSWLPAGVGFLLGGLLLLVVDHLLPHEHPGSNQPEGLRSRLGKRTMMFLAITFHNVPEGFSVGLLFAAAARGTAGLTFASAAALAIGMCIQNVPEGAAVALPLRDEGMTSRLAFRYGTLSGIVEPIGAVLAALLVDWVTPAMPWLLGLAAGAMIYVVADELIPESKIEENPHVGALAVMAGFFIMMVLEGA